MSHLIDVRGVTFSYRPNEPILKGVSFAINEGEFVAVTGPSGCGKSTLFYLLGALVSRFGGDIRFQGRAYQGMNSRQKAIFRNREIGFVFQQFHLLSRASVLENVLLPTYYPFDTSRPSAADHQRALELMTQLDIAELRDRKPHELSGGQQQRVAVARALIRNPNVILADEPTGNLDSKSAAAVMEIFRRLHAQKKTVVLITHSEELAAQCSRVLKFRDGVLESDSGIAAPQVTTAGALKKPDVVVEQVPFLSLFRSLRPAWENITRTKAKAALTMLGISLGIAAVLSTVSLGRFARERILDSYQSLGVNTLSFSGWPNWRRSSRDFAPAVFSKFEWDKDIKPMTAIFDQVAAVSPVISDWSNTFNHSGLSLSENTGTIGVNEKYFAISNQKLDDGRALSVFDVENANPVCIIGADVRKTLFQSGSPLNKTVTILDSGQGSEIPCRVVGSLEPQRSQNESFQPDRQIFLPYTYLERSLSNPWQRNIRELRIKIKSSMNPDAVGKQIEGYFKSRYGNTGQFTANSNAKVIDQMNLFLTVFSSLLTAVAMIALVVGGVGINNMMLVSLAERVKELGLRKALGATPSQIRSLVLTESVLLCGVGGLIGLLAGFIGYQGLIYAATKLIPEMSYEWIFEPMAVIVSGAAIIAAGVFSGLVPALRAERLEVIEALRQDA